MEGTKWYWSHGSQFLEGTRPTGPIWWLRLLIRAFVVCKIDYIGLLAGSSGQLLSRLQSVLNAAARLVFSAKKKTKNQITYLRCSMSSTDCGSRVGFGSGNGFDVGLPLPSKALRRNILPTGDSLCRTADVDGRRRLRSSVSDTLVVAPTNRSATVHSQWLHQERGMACLPQSEPLFHC